MLKRLLLIAFLLSLIASSPRIVTNVMASDDGGSLENVSVTAPDQPVPYGIKRIREKISSVFVNLFNRGNIGNYTAAMTRERAKELIVVVKNDRASHIEKTVSRYITYTGLLQQQLEAKNASKEAVLDALKGVKEKFDGLRDKFPAQSAQWLLMQQAIDSTTVLTSKAQSS